jgi:hypothetical protein
MKTLLPFLLPGLLVVTATAAEPDDQLPPAPQGKSFKLVWHDEFDGDKLDESKWDVPNNRRRDRWWSSQAVSVANGHLVPIRKPVSAQESQPTGPVFGYACQNELTVGRPGRKQVSES